MSADAVPSLTAVSACATTFSPSRTETLTVSPPVTETFTWAASFPEVETSSPSGRIYSIPQEEVYVAINSAAGIPTGIGYRRVVRNHFDFIFFAILQLWVQHHKEVGIPVPLFSHKRIVHEHLRVLINCLKFQHSGLCPPRFRHKKPFDVDIGPAGKYPHAPAVAASFERFSYSMASWGSVTGCIDGSFPTAPNSQPRLKSFFFTFLLSLNMRERFAVCAIYDIVSACD